MIETYNDRRRWSDGFLPEIKKIVGPYLLETPPSEWDLKQATDLIVLYARGVTLACRIRRACYVYQYSHQFTMRSQINNGSETELSKITNGWGDLMFYAFAADDDDPKKGFSRWSLLDLKAFRAHLIRHPTDICRGGIWNGDGATRFEYFDIESFVGEPRLVLAQFEDLSTLF